MLNRLMEEDFMALLMYHSLRFQNLWESGVIISSNPEDDYLKEELKEHAMIMFVLHWEIMGNKRLGYFKRLFTKRMVKKIEKSLIQVGLLVEILKMAQGMTSEIIEQADSNIETAFRQTAETILAISPALEQNVIKQLDGNDIYVQGRRLGFTMQGIRI